MWDPQEDAEEEYEVEEDPRDDHTDPEWDEEYEVGQALADTVDADDVAGSDWETEYLAQTYADDR